MQELACEFECNACLHRLALVTGHLRFEAEPICMQLRVCGYVPVELNLADLASSGSLAPSLARAVCAPTSSANLVWPEAWPTRVICTRSYPSHR